jgi:hypothetical protein
MIPVICNVCGVELDDTMSVCPLCNTPVTMDSATPKMWSSNKQTQGTGGKKKHLLQHILWQITSVLLLSGVLATLAINVAIHGTVTWSIYPVCICLIIFSYTTLTALWHVTIPLQVLAGWSISTLILIGVSEYTHERWPLQLALPTLCMVNIIGLLLYFVIRQIKLRGLNTVAILFAGIAVFCISIDAIISLFFNGYIKLQWSIIVAACLLPVTTTILFMYSRTRNNKELQKIFHT